MAGRYAARRGYLPFVRTIRASGASTQCVGDTWGGVTFPTNTLIGVAALAFPEMIIEVDVTAIVAAK